MPPDIAFNVEWCPSEHGAPEVRQTTGALQIRIGDFVATRNEDDWSQSVHNHVRVSLYPLALWLVSSWWRLRWEPEPYSGEASVGWRMAHEVAAAGDGTLWPSLRFACDGETVDVDCEASNPLVREPVRYLTRFHAAANAVALENAVDELARLVLARLDAVGNNTTLLHSLWRELSEERGDSQMSAFRRFEARMGFDVDQAPAGLLEKLTTVASEQGSEAAEEIASVCSGSNADRVFQHITDFAQSTGISGRLEVPPSLADIDCSAKPWERGWSLAREARRAWRLGGVSINDRKIEELLQIPSQSLTPERLCADRLPLGLAIRGDDLCGLKLLFHKRNQPGLRFEAARFIASHLLASSEERWLPATDAKTARQKVQRAFAAEFLCPFDELEGFLNGDYSPEATEDAGIHFGVSALAVRSHLQNHGKPLIA